MTDKDIIKALKCCSYDNYQCDNCPYAYKTCTVYKDSIDLINHQKAEIERLRSMNRAKLATIHDLQIELKTAKSEAIKEFAERLKNEIISDTAYGCDVTQHTGYYDYTIKIGDIPEYIDDLVKEMAGDNNAE